MDIREGINSQFNDLGFEVSNDVLDKCVEICVLHNIDEEMFVETWTAYSVTHLGGEAPTVDTLVKMERKEFANQSKINSINSPSSRKSTTPLPIYNKTPTSKKQHTAEIWNQSNTTPKGEKTRNLLSKPQGSSFSPASFSPISTTPSGKYSARKNAGEVVFEYLERPARDWKGTDRIPLTISHYREEILTFRQRLMLEPLLEKAAVLNDIIERIGSHLVEINGLQEASSNCEVNQTEVVCVGRICCDSNNHLNPSSVLLEGSRGLCNGLTVPLDLSRLANFALFPGQVVAVVGINPTGQRLIINKLFASAPLPQPSCLPRFSGNVEIVVAAGPFTPTDSLDYEPLQDLMRYVKDQKPHVLILVGPILDLRQPQLTAGSIAESFNTFHEKIVKSLVNQLQGSWTQVVIVSSMHDAVCLPVYPTPPPQSLRPAPSLHIVSDPSLLNINNLVIAVTATDSLMHIGKEEISHPLGGIDRLGRLASHLLQQQHMYPLYPPSEELPIDSELWDCYASLPVTPHILVVPSNFRYFIKNLHGCLVINPEHLCKGASGGTFARLEVEPPTDDIWSPATHISAQIIKV